MAEIISHSKLSQLKFPFTHSHKGQNGRLLIIGGSKTFHAASLWAAQMACHIVDLVHYASTEENQQIMLNLKSSFLNGIIVPQAKLLDYVAEDDCILIGPGMERTPFDENRNEVLDKVEKEHLTYEQIMHLDDEAHFTSAIIFYLISHYPEKKYVFDAAALQMMKPEWLLSIDIKPIVTPHSKEFERLFGISIENHTEKEIVDIVSETAKKYQCSIILKHETDYVTDGEHSIQIKGGNAGLAKGGTGDTLAGLIASFYTKSEALPSMVFSSYYVKKAAEKLAETYGYFYTTSQVIDMIPQVINKDQTFDFSGEVS